MKRIYLAAPLGCLTALALLAGCGHKQPDAKTELEKAAAVIAKDSEQQPPPPPAAPPQPAAETAAPAAPPPPPPPTASAEMQQALAAYKTGQMEDAVTRLQRLRATPTLTAQQRMALQDSIAAVMTEIYALAEKGDTRAIAAVRQYEEMQTRPR